VIAWKNNCRYLGVYFVSGPVFNCSFDYAKSEYFRSVNAILSKVGRYASEEVVISLIYAKCLSCTVIQYRSLSDIGAR